MRRSNQAGMPRSNQSSMAALSVMSKRKPLCGPMTTQPLENRETIPTQTQPVMPAVGRQWNAAPNKQIGRNQPCRNPPLCAESAQLSRQNSLRKQRKAQRAAVALQK